ncbi:asparagine synthase (glutamine-hydrolyzing) [Thalassospiraceae bacterium LMO-SO8]|nr:asparagine synthase (glutamine-hydrolyzing) [Alphaproteobacteria bacterium LMO-S08]WND74853.1 asparagine synthase (glutamine-hydrolyzing) [Thalassospiraceae bacterium LMO-SO8]
MCGIAGIMTRDGSAPPAGILDALAVALAHRGPDGHGRHVDGDVGLIQTRLAIIDLETGDQPIAAKGPDGNEAVLVANGEIYNYVEVKLDLGRVPFKTRSDCEIPLQLYLREELAFTDHLRGMYAIAIHDRARGRLVLTRDPFGIKPLYFTQSGAAFAFASEPQALIRAGLATARLNPMARDEMLQMQFSSGRETPFAGIERVLPGETLIVEKGRVIGRNRMSALPDGPPKGLGRSDALMRLDDLLDDAVGVHQRSDVPYGMFFSGGIDSTVLLAMMSRLNERPVTALTAGFSDTQVHDERALAREIAAHMGADHHEVEFGAADFWDLLPEIAAAVDDPAADYAVLPSYKLARTARERGIKVILSGEGGDEVFAGYGRYRRAMRWRLLGGRPMRERGTLEGLGVLREETRAWRGGIEMAEEEVQGKGWTSLQRAQAVDMADWLPNDLLTKLDRCLMAHGVEGRVPFLDPKLAAFGFGLPDALKVRHGRGKWILRKWLEKVVPMSRPFAAKRGFTVPVGEWILAEGRRLGPLVAAQPGVAEICRPDAVANLFRNAGKREMQAAWTLLFYAVWHRHHILGGVPKGGVLEVLGEAV